MYSLRKTLHHLIPLMVRQAHHERNQETAVHSEETTVRPEKTTVRPERTTVRPELVEGRSQTFLSPPKTHPEAGFSLIELSIVLIIVALMASRLLPSLSEQKALQAERETLQKLEAARDALLGYAILTATLPCPDFQTDPTNATYGQAADTCLDSSTEGWLPFRTLGLPEGDAWFGLIPGSQAGRIVYRVDPAFTRSSGQTISLTTNFLISLSVQDALGNKITSDAERPVAILISPGPDGVLNGENTSFETSSARYEAHPPSSGFDDRVIWLGRPSLFGLLVRGGHGV